jgi:hypothetical protein
MTNPVTNINLANTCFDPVTPGLNLSPIPISVIDPIPGGPGNAASGIKSVMAWAYDESQGGSLLTTQELFPSCTSWSGGSPGQGNGSCKFNTSGWAQPNGHIYRVVIKSTDNAGNSGSISTKFTYKALCIGPWLQSSGGDVHSNTDVNTPGGPN